MKNAKPGELIRIEGTELHCREYLFSEKYKRNVIRNERLIEGYIPQNAVKRIVKLKLVILYCTEVESPTFIISGVDPVVDPSYVLFLILARKR